MKYRRRCKSDVLRADATALCVLASLRSSNSAELSEIVQLVKAKGWTANLGRICQELSLEPHGRDYIFKQISVQDAQGHRDPRRFNVPDGARDVPYVLVFHLSPLVGESFVTSPQRELLKTFIGQREEVMARFMTMLLATSQIEPAAIQRSQADDRVRYSGGLNSPSSDQSNWQGWRNQQDGC